MHTVDIFEENHSPSLYFFYNLFHKILNNRLNIVLLENLNIFLNLQSLDFLNIQFEIVSTEK